MNGFIRGFTIAVTSTLLSSAAEVDVSKIPPAATQKIDFARDVYPIFKEHCISCHGPDKQKGKYRLDTRDGAFKPGENGAAIIPSHAEKSPLIHMVAGLVEEGLMPPPKAEPLTREEIGLLRAWIDQGAVWPDGPIQEYIKKIDFRKDIAPILEKQCGDCHGAVKQAGDFRVDQPATLLKGGKGYGQVIKPGDPKSSILIIVAGKDEDIPQPEKHKLPDKQVDVIKRWIEQGARIDSAP
jgi:mono/diheme cytochrome c family protein